MDTAAVVKEVGLGILRAYKVGRLGLCLEGMGVQMLNYNAG